MTEQQVREVLQWCQGNGSDPYLALRKAGLLWDETRVIRTRMETLQAAAQAIRQLTSRHLPHRATLSAGDMKEHLATYLDGLAKIQEQEHGKQTQAQNSRP